MSASSTIVIAIAQRQRLADEAERLSYIGAIDVAAFVAGAVSLVLAFVASRREPPRVRTLVFAAALIANVWNFCVV